MATAKETAEATKALVTDKVKAAAPAVVATKANMVQVVAVEEVPAVEMALEQDRGSSRANPVKGGTCHIPKPPYPPIAAENGDTGTVMLSVWLAQEEKLLKLKF